MEPFTNIINEANYVLWTYVLVVMLLGCAIWFSVKTRFVQFRMLGEMIRLLGDSTAKINGHEKHISSFQAFTIRWQAVLEPAIWLVWQRPLR